MLAVKYQSWFFLNSLLFCLCFTKEKKSWSSNTRLHLKHLLIQIKQYHNFVCQFVSKTNSSHIHWCHGVYYFLTKKRPMTPWTEYIVRSSYELPHDKTNNMTVCPVKTQISLGIGPVWSESLLSAWRKLGSLATHWVHSEDSWSASSLGTQPHCGFVMRWLIFLSYHFYNFSEELTGG